MRPARVSPNIGGMNSLAELARLIENLVRLGTVADVQVEPPRVRVKSGNVTSSWVPWLALRAGSSKEWDPPTIGEQAVLLSPSGLLTQGVALVGLFSDANPANGDREGLHRRTYADGAVVEYDFVSHVLRATLPAGGVTHLVSTGGIHIEGSITHKGDYTQEGNQQITGMVTVSDDVVAAGISLVSHTHGGVQFGNSQTGSPQ